MPPALVLVAGITALLGLAAIAFGVVQAFNVEPRRWVVGVGTAILITGYGALLLVTANGLRRARRWSRGPAVAVHLLHLPVAYGFWGPPTTWVAAVLGGSALVCLVALLTPTATAALTGGGGLNGPEGQH